MITSKSLMLTVTVLDVTLDTGVFGALIYDQETEQLKECFKFFYPSTYEYKHVAETVID